MSTTENDDESFSQSAVMKFLDYAYEKAVDGVGIPGMDTASELAESYLSEEGTLVEQIDSLIRWQNAKSATSGFITGLGGFITMPVAIPANVSSVIFVQVRMVAAIAIMCGFNVNDDRVKTIVYACLAGNGAKELLKDVGITIGRKLTESAIKNISGATLVKINQAVGFRLFTKFGEKGAINLAKGIPFVGGLVGGTFDAVTTNIVGNVARDTFVGMVRDHIKSD
ncbi:MULTISPECIES: EcsC family protein [Enterobacteriaceae]|uniref:EcsC family protein n=1 Tax=Enterobacteriaceae TaxID=543 RepID=UPI0010A5F47D|nr:MULTISPECIES: EcsC family protein [Enterobacteriaceae]THH68239.1 EcsC family protein [Klebsiella pneumoniae]